MKSLKLDESQCTDKRVAFTIIGKIGNELSKYFYQRLEEYPHLKALRPKLDHNFLYIDLITHKPGVADAFDKIVGEAQDIIEHNEQIDREYRELKAQEKEKKIKEFRESQGLSLGE